MEDDKFQMVKKTSGAYLLTEKEKTQVEALFGRHINKGQLKYLKAGHLDVLETHRQGVRFKDAATGAEMIDCFTSAGCFNVGRHNKEILEALDEALECLDMGSYNMVSPYKTAFAKKLVSLAPGDINHMMFASGGGDAIDGVIKLARGATGRKEIISTIKAYHGHTGFALSANGKEHYREHFEPLMPGFAFVPFNDLSAVKAKASKDTAAIIVEPVQGEAGIFVADDDYLRGLRQICDDLGIMLIFDEIQTGFGRTGKFFASEHSGIVPDIMTLAKSIAGGIFPNAAILYRDIDILTDYVNKNPTFHPSYSGGSDLGCCVSLKVLEFIEKDRLCENAEKMGSRLKGALIDLMRENPKIIKEVRGRGLMLGIEYIHEFMGPMMSDALAKNGVFAAYSGNAPQVMRFMLPIIVTQEEIDEVINAIRAALKSMKVLLPFALPAARIPAIRDMLNNEHIQTVLFSWIRDIEDMVKKGLKAIERRLQ